MSDINIEDFTFEQPAEPTDQTQAEPNVEEPLHDDNVENLRDELIELAESKEINKSVAYIKKQIKRHWKEFMRDTRETSLKRQTRL